MLLFVYAFLSNVALAVVPHEPVVIWYGAHAGIWWTAVVATAGTLAASWVDYRLFVPLIARTGLHQRRFPRPVTWMLRFFSRAPFTIIAASGLTPLPFFPFKAMAFVSRYPIDRYLLAVAAGRLPRYLLLAWLGVALRVPAWALMLLFAALALPSFSMFVRRQTRS